MEQSNSSGEASNNPTKYTSFMICDILDSGRRNRSSTGDEVTSEDQSVDSQRGHCNSSSLVARNKKRWVYQVDLIFSAEKFLTAHQRQQLASLLRMTVKIWYQKSKTQPMEYARLPPKETKDSAPSNFPVACIPVGLSSPQALPTPTAQTQLYTLPRLDHFRYPPLMKPDGLPTPTLPNSIYTTPVQQVPCYVSLRLSPCHRSLT